MYCYRKSYEVIGYAYDADLHCLDCTKKRFSGLHRLHEKGMLYVDNEGNEIRPTFLGDEFDTPPVCGDCLEPLD